METCIPLRRAMLINPVDVLVEDESLDFEKGKEISDQRASEISEDAMLIAWFDRNSGRFSPPVVNTFLKKMAIFGSTPGDLDC